MADTVTSSRSAGFRRVRLVIWGLVALALVVLAVLLLRPVPTTGQSATTPTSFTLGGPFTLTGADGRPFSSTQLAGKPYTVFFGFTHCPDVCPNTLARLAKLRQELGQGEDAYRIVFITVDPERDTPEAVGAYAELFNTPITGLTGSRAQIDQVAKQHAIHQARAPSPDAPDGYTMDHGATTLLFDSAGEFVSTISPEESDAVALDKLRRIAA